MNVNALRYQLLGKFLHELNNSWNLGKKTGSLIIHIGTYRCKEVKGWKTKEWKKTGGIGPRERLDNRECEIRCRQNNRGRIKRERGKGPIKKTERV